MQPNIRDPYVLPYQGKYYMYGTRSATCWGRADGFDCYVSDDLQQWEGPFEVFHRPDGFWAVQNFWAPECYYYHGKFCLIATLGDEQGRKCVNLLQSDSPLGPFRYVSQLTDPRMQAIDGTLYLEGDAPYLVYSRSFENGGKGEMETVRLSQDLTRPEGNPFLLFSAPEAPWAIPIPWAKEEFGMEGEVYFTDGPVVHTMKNGMLAIIWSSWSGGGYAVGAAISRSGKLTGPWEQQKELLFPKNGGHGMLFTKWDGSMTYALHYPDDKYHEHPLFLDFLEEGDKLRLAEMDGAQCRR